MCRVDSFCCYNVGDIGDNDYTANTVSRSINMDKFEAEGTDTVSSLIRACDTDVSHHIRTDDFDLVKIIRTDDFDLVKIGKAFIELNSRRMNYFDKPL